jgi:ABC-type branched-subunit amino acid transport system substrate-binding protein
LDTPGGGIARSRWRGHIGAATALLGAVAIAAAFGATPKGDTSTRQVTAGANAAAAVGAGTTPTSLTGSATSGAGVTSGATTAVSSGAAGGGAGAPAATTKNYDIGVTDTEIRIGGSTFTSGPAAVYGEQIAVGFTAGVQYINDHGGINGRKVVLKLYDDGGDPAKQLTNTKRLLEVDQVFALTMVYAPIVGEYVAQNRVPVYHLGQFDEEFTNPWWFPLGGPQRFASYSLSNFGARTLGVKSVAILYLDANAANYSQQYADEVAKDWRGYGVDVKVMAPFAIDQTSCSDAIGKASAAGVDFIDFELDAGHVINCGVEAQIQGYTPPKGWGGYLIGVPVIHEALGDFSRGMYAFDTFGALYDVPDYNEYIRRVSPKTEAYSSVTISYFIAALLMRDSIARLGDDITRERLAEVLNTFTDWQPGLTSAGNQPTWTWTPQCHLALRGGYVIQIQKGSDNKLRWTQIEPQHTTTYIPPGQTLPARYAGCAGLFQPG